MRIRLRAALAALLIAAAAPVAAAPVSQLHSSFWVLGDSLSDNGNLFAATGGAAPPSPPYFAGRFSNGPVFAESLQAEFLAALKPTANFAFGGARAVADADGIPDLPAQLGLFSLVAAPNLGDRPLVSLLFGANDLFGAIGTPTQEAAADAAANAVADAALFLAADFGVEDFLLFTLPDLGLTPLFTLFSPPGAAALATAATERFNDTLLGRLPGLEAAGLTAHLVDGFGLSRAIAADPASFGVADAVTPCVIVGVSVCTPEVAEQLAFFDAVHPNATIHLAIADAARAAVVPLPATAPLLLAALALAASFRRRRA